MNKREKTKKIKIGNITIGGSNHIVIQTMLTSKTSNIEETINKINYLASIGCELVRLAILDEEDAVAIPAIKEKTNIPIVGDIHFSAKLALLVINNGIDGIRINPGNFKNDCELEKIIALAKEKKIAIRIGINTGSFPTNNYKKLVAAILKETKKIEKMGFHNLVLAIKSSNIETTIKANLLLAKKTHYPLHIGLTEAGDFTTALIKSTFFFSNILKHNVANTIRISLPGDEAREIDACKMILKLTGNMQNSPEIISCPTCGRITCDTSKILEVVTNLTRQITKNIKIAVMGCIVNGVGEAKDANIGIFPVTKDEFVIYVDGKVKTKVSLANASQVLKEIILNY